MVRCAAELAPNDADILAYLSFRSAHFPALAPDAVRWSDKAAALNPYAPDWYHWNRGAAMMVVGRFAEAAEAYARARTTSYRVPAKSPRSRSRARWRRPAPGWRTCYAMRLLSPPRGMPKLRAFIPTLPPSMHAALTGRGWRSTEIQRNLAAARRSSFPKAGARCESRMGRPFRRRRRGSGFGTSKRRTDPEAARACHRSPFQAKKDGAALRGRCQLVLPAMLLWPACSWNDRTPPLRAVRCIAARRSSHT